MLRHAFAVALACVPLAIPAQQAESFEAERTVQLNATIHSVSRDDRHVTLLTSDGKKVTVQAGSAVKNLDQINSGDKVVVVYREGLSAQIRPKDASPPATANTVRIEAVDPAEHSVTFTRNDGKTRKMVVMRADAKQFVEKLKPGDRVDVTFREPVAISIERSEG
jgi:endonuclease YncB( thermonuclease family)